MAWTVEAPTAGDGGAGETPGEEETHPAKREQRLLGVGGGDGVGHCPGPPRHAQSRRVPGRARWASPHSLSGLALPHPRGQLPVQGAALGAPRRSHQIPQAHWGVGRGVGTGTSDRSPGPGPTQVCRGVGVSFSPQGGGEWDGSCLPAGPSASPVQQVSGQVDTRMSHE